MIFDVQPANDDALRPDGSTQSNVTQGASPDVGTRDVQGHGDTERARAARRRLSTAELLTLLREKKSDRLEFNTFARVPRMSAIEEILLRVATDDGGRLVAGATDDPSVEDPLQRVVGLGNPEQIASALRDAASIAEVDLWIDTYKLAGKTLMVADVTRPEGAGPPRRQSPGAETKPRLRVLAIATEWLSRHGGLSTFNRELCSALARAQCSVTCLVPDASADDLAAARAVGVDLLVAAPTPGADERARLMRPPTLKEEPHLVIGHGRVTGPAALALCEDIFPAAPRLHFVHTVAEEIEWFKQRGLGTASTVAGERDFTEKELARAASLVVGVGPLLRRKAATMLRGLTDAPDVVGILPGLTVRSTPDGLPDDRQILLLGRTEDRHLKGLDIAARALGSLDFGSFDDGYRPTLVVRGSPPEDARDLRADLLDLSGHRISVLIRDYTVNRELIEADLLRASLVLMPSRHEGFGLVALEAIGAGIPVLVSDTSGIGEHLLREGYARFVVPTRGDDTSVTAAWSRAVDRTLFDLDAAFARAADLRDALASEMSWDRAVDNLLTAVRGVNRRQARSQESRSFAP